jgi:hypothetical protein
MTVSDIRQEYNFLHPNKDVSYKSFLEKRLIETTRKFEEMSTDIIFMTSGKEKQIEDIKRAFEYMCKNIDAIGDDIFTSLKFNKEDVGLGTKKLAAKNILWDIEIKIDDKVFVKQSFKYTANKKMLVQSNKSKPTEQSLSKFNGEYQGQLLSQTRSYYRNIKGITDEKTS